MAGERFHCRNELHSSLRLILTELPEGSFPSLVGGGRQRGPVEGARGLESGERTQQAGTESPRCAGTSSPSVNVVHPVLQGVCKDKPVCSSQFGSVDRVPV